MRTQRDCQSRSIGTGVVNGEWEVHVRRRPHDWVHHHILTRI